MKTWHGKPVSPGYAEGVAVVFSGGSSYVIPLYDVDGSSKEEERRRLRDAVAAAMADLEELEKEMSGLLGKTDAAIFATHRAFLEDRSFRAQIEQRLAQEGINAEQAVEKATADLAAAFSDIDDEYIRDRGQDVRDVGRRIVGHLMPSASHDLAALPPGSIVVAHELLPSETVLLDRQHVRAIVTEEGSKTSHASILAKALGIPSVTGVPDICTEVVPGAPLLVDGCRGTVVMEPSTSTSTSFARSRDDYERLNVTVAEAAGMVCGTQDGTRIELYANLGRVAEAVDIRAHHLEGVGLFRTEVLFLDSDTPPTVELQREVYRQVAVELAGLPLVIRTLDLGGDKQPAFLPTHSQHNPSIGLRGLRFALREIELLRTQLEAIVEVAQEYPVSVMFPMVVAGDDLGRAIDLLRQAAAHRGYSTLPPIGAMIETPSSVFALPEIARQSDFISIGTNDLTQFILAADRDAADLLDEFSVLHPAVLRAIDMIVEEAASADLPVTVCGEAAGDPEIAPLLVGLGLRKLSMSPLRAARVRMALCGLRLDAMEQVARDALASDSIDAVRCRLAELAPETPSASATQ